VDKYVSARQYNMQRAHLYWKIKAKNTHSEYIIFIVFPRKIWLHERASILRLYTHCPFCIFTAMNFLFSV